MRPSVFVAVVNNQATRFGCCLESLVVVGTTAAAILNAVDVIVVVNHFMQQGSAHKFYISTESTGSDIDFMCTA